MKKLLLISLLLFSGSANATTYYLVSCEYEYVMEYGQSYWVGVYQSQYGNYFTQYFNAYCPQVIQQ